MSPETGNIQTQSTMTEAEMISNELLSVHKEMISVYQADVQAHLHGLRERIGYEAAPVIEQSMVVDTNNKEPLPVITPAMLEAVLPLTEASLQTTHNARTAVENILTGEDKRLIVIVGPCSIDDPEAAIQYAREVSATRVEYGDEYEIIMRFYPEKPRTELGRKGLIYDPKRDNSNDINLGVTLSRLLACQATNMGVPIAMERLNASTPQYFNGLVAYDAIGARNTLDQKARGYASGTSSPIGFKNTTEGSILAAAEAVKTANAPHTFLGMGIHGMPMQIHTTGNPFAHVIARGYDGGHNFDAESIAETERILASKNLLQAIVVDASHGNSVDLVTGKKDHMKQFDATAVVARQISLGETAIKGIMLESNLRSGNQKFVAGKTDVSTLARGVSITDVCIDINQTHLVLKMMSDAINH